MNLDNYMAGYMDRRMNQIIEEWQLATKGDLQEIVRRFTAVQEEVHQLKTFERTTAEKLTELEERARVLREMKR
ncbi:MAG TPA: hypothetical protein VN372_10920 [Methanospirillum sp.]|nr:hypothetical protein [Methanospirillum sp.]